VYTVEAVILSTKHSTLTHMDVALRHWFQLERERLNVALVIGKGGETVNGIQAGADTRPHLCST
jgi:hypothetical protein